MGQASANITKADAPRQAAVRMEFKGSALANESGCCCRVLRTLRPDRGAIQPRNTPAL